MAKFQQRSVSMNSQTADLVQKVSEIRGISFSEALRTLAVFGYLRYMEMLKDINRAGGVVNGDEEEQWP